MKLLISDTQKNMKIEKSIVRIKVLLERIDQCKRSVPHGVLADGDEVRKIWAEYHDLRNTLIEIDPDLFNDLIEVKKPQGDTANSFSRFEPKSLVYHKLHFREIENEVIKAREFAKIIKSNSNYAEVVPHVTINASHGSSVSYNTGNNNSVVQNISNVNKVYEELEKLGVNNEELDNLKAIVNQKVENKEDNNNKTSKILKWIGTVSASLAARGLYENIHTIVLRGNELIENLTQF